MSLTREPSGVGCCADSREDGSNCSRAEAGTRSVSSTPNCCGSNNKSPGSAQHNQALCGEKSSGMEDETRTISSCSNTACNSTCCSVQKAPPTSEWTTKNAGGDCRGPKLDPTMALTIDPTRSTKCCQSSQANACTGSIDADCRGSSCCDEEEVASQVVHDSCVNAPRDTVKAMGDGDSSTSGTERLDGCCSKSLSTSAEDCCKGKSSPCCDEKCVDILVARECDDRCSESLADCYKSGCVSSCNEERESSADAVTVRKSYHKILRNIGCLCRAAKSRGQSTCCIASPGIPIRVRRKSLFDDTVNTGGKGNDDNTDEVFTSTKNKSCVDSCCKSEKSFDALPKDKLSARAPFALTPGNPPNLEDGFPDLEHVVLSVSGLTCVGCETKLRKSFASIKSATGLKTSLVLCRAEFDLDLRYDSVENVIRQLHRMTEFRIVEVKQVGSEIEVCVPDAKAFARQTMPLGIHSIVAVDKLTARISYDPSIVGARDLLERGFDSPLSIARIKPDAGLAASSRHVWHAGYMALLSAALTIPVLVLAWMPMKERPITYDGVSLGLATLVQFVVAGPFYPTALRSLIFARMIEMDLLIVMSTSAAYIFSVVSFAYTAVGKPLPTGDFFETSTLLVTLIMVARWLSALARQKAIESVSVRSLQTPTAVLYSAQDQSEKEIDARLLQYGDLFRVGPESRVPTDGVIITGNSEVDESMVTGESVAVEKRPGSSVLAGSINGSGVITVRLTNLPGSNTISAIANMVDEARLSKPKIQHVADRVASYIVPIAIALAILTFVIWIPIEMRKRHEKSSGAVASALTYAITVLVVTCPCAIGLAVPMVIVIAGGVAAKRGCVFQTASAIETACKTSHVIFDKTGTLTQGKLMITAERYIVDDTTIAEATYALLSNIKHPVAMAVRKHVEDKVTAKIEASDVISHTAKGVQGLVGGRTFKAGNSRWLSVSDHPEVADLLSQGYTTFCVTVDDKLAAVFGLQDSLRADAKETVMMLQKRGIQVSILSGDDEGPVAAIAHQLNITSFRSRCSPADKKHFVQELNDNSRTTLFCGDGTNDAAALAQATIGVHVSHGTDIAKSAADVVLIRSSLSDILTLIALSEASMLRIKINFIWAFIYNVVAILFASGALVNVRIPPEYAALGELVSVLPVIIIAIQLRWA